MTELRSRSATTPIAMDAPSPTLQSATRRQRTGTIGAIAEALGMREKSVDFGKGAADPSVRAEIVRSATPADFSVDGEYVYEVSEVQSKVTMLTTMTKAGIHLDTKSGSVSHHYPWHKIATFRVLPSGNIFIFEVVVDGILAGWQLKTAHALDMVGTATAFVDALVSEAARKGHARSSAVAGTSSSTSTGGGGAGGRVRRSRAGSSAGGVPSSSSSSSSSSRRGTRRGTGAPRPLAPAAEEAADASSPNSRLSPLARTSAGGGSRDSRRSSQRISGTVKTV